MEKMNPKKISDPRSISTRTDHSAREIPRSHRQHGNNFQRRPIRQPPIFERTVPSAPDSRSASQPPARVRPRPSHRQRNSGTGQAPPPEKLQGRLTNRDMRPDDGRGRVKQERCPEDDDTTDGATRSGDRAAGVTQSRRHPSRPRTHTSRPSTARGPNPALHGAKTHRPAGHVGANAHSIPIRTEQGTAENSRRPRTEDAEWHPEPPPPDGEGGPTDPERARHHREPTADRGTTPPNGCRDPDPGTVRLHRSIREEQCTEDDTC